MYIQRYQIDLICNFLFIIISLEDGTWIRDETIEFDSDEEVNSNVNSNIDSEDSDYN